ncbi:MAG: hypothetical protein V4850_02715 [Myxococcota bacterium]
MLLFALLFACTDGADSGGPLPDGACATTADCAGDLECSGPNDWRGCGIGPTEACASDADCGTDLRCHVVSDNCSADGFGSACDAACTPDTCAEGLACADGACRAVSCVADPSLCPAHQACDPGSVTASTAVYDRHHGCVDVACADDPACADGLACVNGICQDGPGTCAEVYAVP